MSTGSQNRLTQRTRAPSRGAEVRSLEDSLEDKRLSGEEATDWQVLCERFRSQLRGDSLESLARQLEVSSESLRRLGIGFDSYQYTFPMKSSDGRVVGIRTRPQSGGKWTMEGGKLGLFIPEGVTPANVETICEGESDTAASLTAGVQAIGLPHAGGAIGEAVAFVSKSPVACPCIFADNDTGGRSGAEQIAEALLANDVPCKVLSPPAPYKDLREWASAENLTSSTLRQKMDSVPTRWPDRWPPGFVMVPNAFFRRGSVKKLGTGPVALACVLSSFHGSDGRILPERELLAELLGVKISTVDRYKKMLKEAGVAGWKRGGPSRCNEYEVNFGPLRKNIKI